MATNSNLIFRSLTNVMQINAAQTAYGWASMAPFSASQEAMVFVGSLKAGAPDTPALTGTNGWNATWTQVSSVQSVQTPAGSFVGGAWFTGVPSSTTAGVLTATYGSNQSGSVGIIMQSPFVNATTPTVQSLAANDTTASTALPALTLGSALSATQNWMLAALFQNSATVPASLNNSSSPYSPPGGNGSATIAGGLAVRIFAVPANSFTPAATTWVASVGKVLFGIEVNQDGTGVVAGSGVSPTYIMLRKAGH